ncbi:hypothetical protein CDD83_1186 [Cordyceps sp. RAO-2017]|nr:hypothetical protein CDD83_1186 [Cordyceps sp. RAO-2017]
MAPSVPCATVDLGYPLFALDFDPDDANRLVVGGGSGAGGFGGGNKITVLETPSQEELRVAGELELARDEDCVMSLAVCPAQKAKTMRLYAGINSSPAAVAKGVNQHLRTLAVEPQARNRSSSSSSSPPPPRASPSKAGASVKVAELARTALFSDPDAETYQRLLRIAGPPGACLGAAASAMGKKPQIAIFDAGAGPRAAPKLRGLLELPHDAEDLDLMQTGDDTFQLAFCYKYELHVFNIGRHGGGGGEPDEGRGGDEGPHAGGDVVVVVVVVVSGMQQIPKRFCDERQRDGSVARR